MARALKALARFKMLCQTIRVGEVLVLATAAARDAQNGPEFLARAEDIVGRKVELLSGAREAELSSLGVISGFHEPDGVVGDLGGGSLELVEVTGLVAGQGVTLPLGGLTLQDLSDDSPKKAQRMVREALPARAAARGAEGAHLLRGRRHLAQPRPPAHGRAGLSAARHARLPDRPRRRARLPRDGRAHSVVGVEGDRRRLRRPPAAARLWSHRARGDHSARQARERDDLGAGRAGGPALRAARRRAQGRRPR